MTKRRKLLIPLLCMALSMSSILTMESNAKESSGEQTSEGSGLKDENIQRLEKVTAVDENGNVFEVDESEYTPQEVKRATRSVANGTPVVNFNTKGNAVTEYTEYGTGRPGYTNGAVGGDAAYLGEEGGKVKFMQSGVIGLVAKSEVQILNYGSTAEVVSCYQISEGNLIHRVGYDITTPGWASHINNGPAPGYLNVGTTYYSYDGHYFYTDYATMIGDYQNNTRSRSVNANNPFYNYYQYLPLRSTTGYSGSELNGLINGMITTSGSKLANTGEQFVQEQNTYGVNALLMASVAACESGWGSSSISQKKNNLFGLNAVDSSPGTSASTYGSVQACIKDFANGWMSKGYLYPNDWRYRGGFLGNKGSGANVSYASAPYWGEVIAGIAWNLDQNGGGRDNGAYTIGIKDTANYIHNTVNVRQADSTSSAALYTTGAHSDYAVLLKESGATNSFYKIQSDGVLNGDRSAIIKGVGEYNFDNMYAYISSDSITVVNSGKNTVAPKELTDIQITTPPTKTTYVEGEQFNPSGMVVMAVWSDGTQTDVTGSVTYPKDALAVGTSSIQVQYSVNGVTKEAAQGIVVNAKPAITGIAINPGNVELKVGESKTFGVSITGTGNPSQAVTWSVEGAQSTDTKIDSTGKLQIAQTETAQTFSVKVTSATDGSKVAIATVTVIQEPVEEPGVEEPNPEEPNPEEPDVPGEDIPSEEPSVPDVPSTDEPSIDEPSTDEPSIDEPGADTPTDDNNEVEDAVTGIKLNGVVPKEATLSVTTIGADSTDYATLTEKVKTNTVIGAYEVELDKELSEGTTVQLSFPVESQYEGQAVIVLHHYDVDGTIFTEEFKPVVKDGMATVEVSSFSPFILALDDAKEEVPPVEPEAPIIPPETGDGNPEQPPANGVIPPPTDGNVGTETPTPPADEGSNTTTPPINGETNVDGGNTLEQDTDTTINNKQTAVPPVADTTSQPGVAKAPKTADQNQILLLSILMSISLMGVLVCVWRFRKKRA